MEREGEMRQQVAAEVLKLGQELFDAVIEALIERQGERPQNPDLASVTPKEVTDEPYPLEEVRGAADEFFAALRLLLDLEPPSAGSRTSCM